MPVVTERSRHVDARAAFVVEGTPDEPGVGRLITDGLRHLEGSTARRFGPGHRPLLVAVAFDGREVDGIGLCDLTVPDLLRRAARPDRVWDAYAELVSELACAVHGCDPTSFLVVREHGRTRVSGRQLVYRAVVGEDFPQLPVQQLADVVLAGLRRGGAVTVRASELLEPRLRLVPVPRSA